MLIFGEPDLQPLKESQIEERISLLRSPDQKVGFSVLNNVSWLKDKRVVPLLLKALEEEKDSAIRERLLTALGFSGDERVLPVMLKVIMDENESNMARQNSINILSYITAISTSKSLETILKNKANDPYLRATAANAMGRNGSFKAFDLLIEALEDENERVRKGAIEALGNLRDKRAVKPLVKFLETGVAEAAEALGKLGDRRIVDALLDAANKYPDFYLLECVVYALGELQDKRGIEFIFKALEGETLDRELLSTAENALKLICEEQDLDLLVQILQDKSRHNRVRNMAAQVLGEIGNYQVVEALIAITNEDATNDSLTFYANQAIANLQKAKTQEHSK